MSDDIVARLHKHCVPRLRPDLAAVLREAAAEIERLRGEAEHWKQARAEALAGGDVLRAEIERLRADNAIYEEQEIRMECWIEQRDAEIKLLRAEIERLRAALKSVLDACDAGYRVERGAGGMTVEAQMRRSVYVNVPALPIEEARAALEAKP